MDYVNNRSKFVKWSIQVLHSRIAKEPTKRDVIITEMIAGWKEYQEAIGLIIRDIECEMKGH